MDMLPIVLDLTIGAKVPSFVERRDACRVAHAWSDGSL